MTDYIEYTHYGWFGFCPILIANIDVSDTEYDCLHIAPRWAIVTPLFFINEKLQQLMISILSLINDDYEPGWLIHVSGEIKKKVKG